MKPVMLAEFFVADANGAVACSHDCDGWDGWHVLIDALDRACFKNP